MASHARGSAGALASRASSGAGRLAGAADAAGVPWAVLAVLSAVSPCRAKREARTFQGCVPATAALRIRHGRAAATGAATTALANYHGQHDCRAVRPKRHG